jgi:hydroxymethylpyrimidine pyrophosphatase-like HAD family hydrolase
MNAVVERAPKVSPFENPMLIPHICALQYWRTSIRRIGRRVVATVLVPCLLPFPAQAASLTHQSLTAGSREGIVLHTPLFAAEAIDVPNIWNVKALSPYSAHVKKLTGEELRERGVTGVKDAPKLERALRLAIGGYPKRGVSKDERARFDSLALRLFHIVWPLIPAFGNSHFDTRREGNMLRRHISDRISYVLKDSLQFWRKCEKDSEDEKRLIHDVRSELLLIEHLVTKRGYEQSLLEGLTKNRRLPYAYYPHYTRSESWQNRFLELTEFVEELALYGYNEEAVARIRDAVTVCMNRLAEGVRTDQLTASAIGMSHVPESDIVMSSLEHLIDIAWERVDVEGIYERFAFYTVLEIADKIRLARYKKQLEENRPPPVQTVIPQSTLPHFVLAPKQAAQQRLEQVLELALQQVAQTLRTTERQVQASVETRKPLTPQALDALEKELRQRAGEAFASYRAAADAEGMPTEDVDALIDALVRDTRQNAAMLLIKPPAVRDFRTQRLAEIALRNGRRSAHYNFYFSRKDGTKVLTYDLLHLLKYFDMAPFLNVIPRSSDGNAWAEFVDQLRKNEKDHGLEKNIRADTKHFLDLLKEDIDWLEQGLTNGKGEDRIDVTALTTDDAELRSLPRELKRLRDAAQAMLELEPGRLDQHLTAYIGLYAQTVALADDFAKGKRAAMPWMELDNRELDALYRTLKQFRESDREDWLGPELSDLQENEFTRLVFVEIPGASAGAPAHRIVSVGGPFYSWMEDEALRHHAIKQSVLATGQRWRTLHSEAGMVSALLFRIGGMTKVLVIDGRPGSILKQEEMDDDWRQLLRDNRIDDDDVITLERDSDEAAPPPAASLEAGEIVTGEETPEETMRRFGADVVALLNADGTATLITDYDNTVEKARQRLTMNRDILVQFLRAGHRLGILTGGDKNRIVETFFNPLLEAIPAEERAILGNLLIGPDNGAQLYRYNVKEGRLERVFIMDITDKILPKLYPKIAQAILKCVSKQGVREMLKKVMHWKFDQEEWATFRKTFVYEHKTEDEKVTQITFYVIGKNASNADKKRFALADQLEENEYRKRYKVSIRHNLMKDGIKLTVIPSGDSSIDLLLPHIDKAFGVAIMATFFDINLCQVIFTGDAFDMNDAAALKAAWHLGNVGKLFDFINSHLFRPGAKFYQLPDSGPAGFRQFVETLMRAA